MTDIGIVHTDLTVFGGGDGLALNVIESLQRDYSVELLTLSDPDIDELNSYFGTQVNQLPVHKVSKTGRLLWSKKDHGLGLAATAFLCRGANRYADRYDLLVSTVSEFNLSGPNVQYVHYPRHDYRLISDRPLRNIGYEWFCEALTEYSAESVRYRTRLLANSEYTAELIEKLYDIQVKVVYPPVKTVDINPEPWNNREHGFVSVGAVTPKKRQLFLINVLEELRSLGHDIHYHIVGPLEDKTYADKVRSAAEQRGWVNLEDAVSRKKLTGLLCSHKYAIHGMPNEHFGIAVAEMVAAGTIPFVPNDGGQREVVGKIEALCYENKDDAVKKIDRMLSDEELADKVRNELPDVDERFGKDRFQYEIREEVNAVLDEI